MVVETDTDQLRKELHEQGRKYPDHEQERLNLRYCMPIEVNKKRQKFLVFKGAFLAKMLTMKLAGQKQVLMEKFVKWIEENSDDLYQRVDREKLAKFAAQQEALRRHAVTK